MPTLLKKIIVAFLLLAVLSIIILGFTLKKFGINPALWISMPSASQFDNSQSNTITISLEPIHGKFTQPTDFQFFPNSSPSNSNLSNNNLSNNNLSNTNPPLEALVLQKSGEVFHLNLTDQSTTLLFTVNVITKSEQGLLGVAIHPNYPATPCIYLNGVFNVEGKDTSRISEWCMDDNNNQQRWFQHKVLFELEQPYANHNAGHLVFDQAGLLYIPWGDGGSANDPHGHGQNLQSYLGTVIRINPEAFNPELPYSIPPDNPFINNPDIADEIYAYGFRNPWKISFDNQQRLIAADVGQNLWEEITFVEAGKNHGWNIMEGTHCFTENCLAKGIPANMTLPFVEYGRELGRSITGGYQYLAEEIPALTGKYVFGDFVSGRIWAADLPQTPFDTKLNTSDSAVSHTAIYDLGQWPLLISTFARDPQGNVYVADFALGKIYRITPSQI